MAVDEPLHAGPSPTSWGIWDPKSSGQIAYPSIAPESARVCDGCDAAKVVAQHGWRVLSLPTRN